MSVGTRPKNIEKKVRGRKIPSALNYSVEKQKKKLHDLKNRIFTQLSEKQRSEEGWDRPVWQISGIRPAAGIFAATDLNRNNLPKVFFVSRIRFLSGLLLLIMLMIVFGSQANIFQNITFSFAADFGTGDTALTIVAERAGGFVLGRTLKGLQYGWEAELALQEKEFALLGKADFFGLSENIDNLATSISHETREWGRGLKAQVAGIKISNREREP